MRRGASSLRSSPGCSTRNVEKVKNEPFTDDNDSSVATVAEARDLVTRLVLVCHVARRCPYGITGVT